MTATVNQIFDYIQGINPSSQTVSSIGTFVTAAHQSIAEREVLELVSVLVNSDKKDTLAFKILSTNTKFSDKQIWVIAFELIQNLEFSEKVEAYYLESSRKIQAKNDASKAKLKANKEASADVLSEIKQAGKKLGDYYIWLKKSTFKKEFFSKKYSTESVTTFLAL